ncbi:DNA-3-methyladenine glycosylase family protein [Bergeyella sp. RCAD1439]|uniref:DNA-3-methyladenine glycosylase family protein n=1 Tax=Bergeyella anatis TaxID=3113737 RepID=UPI002E19D065|nr:DNA-3-methyladenine glycosylase 2 family protein [Bergeyella sp. RCAD1439]
MLVFQYGTQEINYLKSKDKKLAEAIERIGMIERPIIPDLFKALMKKIVGQQISTKTQESIWQKMKDLLTTVDAPTIAAFPAEELQRVGLSFRKVSYMQGIAQKVACKELILEELHTMSDAQVCQKLCELKGIGVWTAEMLMIFSMQRPDVLSYGDLAIHRGLRMLHRHREITPKLFEKYRRRYSPYGSVASLYLWEIAGGAIPEMMDYAIKKS